MNNSEKIDLFQEFIESYLKEVLLEAARRDSAPLIISFEDLSKFNIDLAESLLQEPDTTIECCEQAIKRFDINKQIKARFTNLPSSAQVYIRNIRSAHLNKLIKVIGVIRQKSDVKPQVTEAKFECPSCGNIISTPQEDTVFRQPQMCHACGRKGKFKLLSKHLVDVQRVVVEESAEDLEGGAQPKRISVYLKEDLTSPFTDRKSNPGTKIIIVGVLKEIPITNKAGSQSVTYDLIIFGNHIEPVEEDFTEIKINEEEEEKILQLSKDPNIFNLLSDSLAPSIYGHDQIKAALLLQLFGGVRKVRDDGVITRGDTHILLIGDPGSGKSQLIKRLSVVAPKARYVSGKGVSGAGLTAAVVKDEFTNGWSLEAGALVLAHKGFCAIDEMDKMNKEDRDAMHEGLEQQTVSISKANIQATLRCETTVLAAANPKFGRFDPYLPIAEQIDMPPSLINRFDLIFPVKDLPDRDRDRQMSHFILKLHQSATVTKQEVPIETDMLRKYISYARQKCRPRLTDESIKVIEDYYVQMRNSGADDSGVKSVPISARQLEGIMRLAESAAKIKLKKEVEPDEAQFAIDLVQYCLQQIAMDQETGKIDIDKISSGISASDRGKMISLHEIISELTAKIGKIIPIDDIVKEAEKRGMSADKVEENIEKLKRSGDLFEPKRGFISKL